MPAMHGQYMNSTGGGHAGMARAALLGCRVSELEDLKRQLLLSFTHELNTPLHEVMGCLDALMSATGSSSLPGTTLPLAHTAHSSAHRAARLVKSMTDAVQVPPYHALSLLVHMLTLF